MAEIQVNQVFQPFQSDVGRTGRFGPDCCPPARLRGVRTPTYGYTPQDRHLACANVFESKRSGLVHY